MRLDIVELVWVINFTFGFVDWLNYNVVNLDWSGSILWCSINRLSFIDIIHVVFRWCRVYWAIISWFFYTPRVVVRWGIVRNLIVHFLVLIIIIFIIILYPFSHWLSMRFNDLLPRFRLYFFPIILQSISSLCCRSSLGFSSLFIIH